METRVATTLNSVVTANDRRSSTTSESSLEPMDLGRSPRKLRSSKSDSSSSCIGSSGGVGSTHQSNATRMRLRKITSKINNNNNNNIIKNGNNNKNRCTDSDENYDSDDDDDEYVNRNDLKSNEIPRTIVHIEPNDNPNSLRKKFRISSTPNTKNITNNNINNNKNNIDQIIDNSNINNCSIINGMKISDPTTQQNFALERSCSPSSSLPTTPAKLKSSSPSSRIEDHTNNESGFVDASSHNINSSPESGIIERNGNNNTERDDVKYLCPICEVVSATPHEFTNHIRCHNYSSGDSENFTCRICSKVLSSASSLDRHVLVHTGERPFNCKYCHLTFTTNGNMHRHMRTHKQHQHQKRNRHGNNGNVVGGTGGTGGDSGGNGPGGTVIRSQSTNSNNSGTGSGFSSNGGADGESYESDGCSTDSSASSSNTTNNINNNNYNNNNNNVNNYKRKSTDDDNGIIKRRMKTTINNNNIVNKNEVANNDSHISGITFGQKFCCPVCNRNDFISMLLLGTHMDREHPGIPAKCRQCEIIFKTHKALNNHRCTNKMNITQGFKDITFVDFSSEKFPLIAKSLCEQTIRTPITSQKYECPKCYRAFPCASAVDIHIKDCGESFPRDYSLRKQSRSSEMAIVTSESSDEENRRDEFFAHLDLQNKSAVSIGTTISSMSSPRTSEKSTEIKIPTAEIMPPISARDNELSPKILSSHESENAKEGNHHQEQDFQQMKTDYSQLSKVGVQEKYQQQQPLYIAHAQTYEHQQEQCKDLADIQSILNVTSSSNSFLRNFEKCVNTPSSSDYGSSYGKDEEEAQDAFTSEFRKMKLRGEFPCKLCTAVFPNLRALKGHNRIHLTAAGAGPYRCNMCPYSIHDKAALIRHMRTHNGDRPYECAVCNYAFTTKANCERHLRNRHGKTTRDEVKRAIIYHPSEDSSCEDPIKKMHMFSSPEIDIDDEQQQNNVMIPPKDRSTPVSHLKEMLQADKPAKIQVKSLEKLIDKAAASFTNKRFSDDCSDKDSFAHHQVPMHNQEQSINDNSNNDSNRPMDLSMDVLDLSKKPKPAQNNTVSSEGESINQEKGGEQSDNLPVADQPQDQQQQQSKIDLNILEKNNEFLLAQQKLLNETLPKMDPAQYLSHLYRNLVFSPLHPFFLPNSFLPNNLNDFNKFAPNMLMNPIFGAGGINASTPPVPGVSSLPSLPNTVGGVMDANVNNNSQTQIVQQQNPTQLSFNTNIDNSLAQSAASHSLPPSQLLKSTQNPLPPQLNISRHAHLPPQLTNSSVSQSSQQHTGPVKMVIKNGVLMPKQKQRRYRTERPFACEHCSARFTLRSNMERHIKQQHPQYWAQRQRTGHHIMRGRGSNNSSNLINLMPSTVTNLPSSSAPNIPSTGGPVANFGAISDHVKHAILAQHLKSKKDTDLLQHTLTAETISHPNNDRGLDGDGNGDNNNDANLNNNNENDSNNNFSDEFATNYSQLNTNAEDDDPKLVIDEEDEEEDLDEDTDNEEVCEDDIKPEDLSKSSSVTPSATTTEPVTTVSSTETSGLEDKNDHPNPAAKKVAETILEQAIRSTGNTVKQYASNSNNGNNSNDDQTIRDFGLKIANNMIARAESVGKYLKEVASSSFKDESSDLASVSKLVDNATNSLSFNNYFRPSDIVNHMEQSDEEGLVASGSASESNNSGTEEIQGNSAPDQKKKSAYSLAPNRVSCPYCQRMFPWSSSLRRHILTHTGQKPFKCSHCPLLFTTKSNCDRHLLRKHGNVESAVSLYVPIEDVLDPLPAPKAVEEIEQEKQRQLEKQQHQQQQQRQEQQNQQQQISAKNMANLNATNLKTESIISSSDLPFKCHLCDNSFSERVLCLDHIKVHHAQEFALLLAKGAIDPEGSEQNHAQSAEDEDHHSSMSQQQYSRNHSGDGRGGKYPDYANRKVICAFCMRRFWSTEDLRRHMRTHSGERPFQCEVCLRKFTLKHSMLRHMKKHSGGHNNNQLNAANSGSDMSDDEQPPAGLILANSLRNYKIQELLNKTETLKDCQLLHGGGGGTRKNFTDLKENSLNFRHNSIGAGKSEGSESCGNPTNNGNEENNSDLIGNLLGINDQGILNKLLSSPDEAAKLLGVDK